jgi:hypothetical protein
MGAWGIETWIQRGEAFSNYFRMFSLLSPLQVRDGRLGVRRPLSGTGRWADVPGSVALVIVAIGLTTFDGAQEGALATPTSCSTAGSASPPPSVSRTRPSCCWSWPGSPPST